MSALEILKFETVHKLEFMYFVQIFKERFRNNVGDTFFFNEER